MNLFTAAKAGVFATAIVPDGYNGDTVLLEISLLQDTIVAVHAHGFHGLGLPKAKDLKEAIWLVCHHPNARRLKRLRLITPE